MMKIRAKESSKKGKLDVPIDFISALPDSLLLHILSFLCVKRAAMTCVLSKRWQYLWADLPLLKLNDFSYGIEKTHEFVALVHRILLRRRSNHLEKFKVCCLEYNKRFDSDVNAWLEFCVNNKVKYVSLWLSTGADAYVLPQIMYSNSFLKKLRLGGCNVAPRKMVNWGSLTKLNLYGMKFSDHSFENILSGCPVLNTLILSFCWGLDRLEVHSRSLRELEVSDIPVGSTESLLEISAPHINSLKISMNIDGRRSRLTNISSLVSIDISFSGSWDTSSEELVFSYAKELFQSIQHVKKLELGYGCSKLLSVLLMKGWRFQQSRRDCLIVYASRDNQIIPGFVNLLESSPNLETLIIDLNLPWNGDHPPRSYLMEGDLNSDLLHLKTVNIRGFTCSNVVDQPMLLIFAKILLKRAVVLEKMSIDIRNVQIRTRPRRASSDYTSVAQTLLSYPRSSTKATILLRC